MKRAKKCKRLTKSVVEKNNTCGCYKNCLFTGEEQLLKMNVIRSHNHEVYTEEVNKVALSPNDDKRYILEDKVHTLALVHYKIFYLDKEEKYFNILSFV